MKILELLALGRSRSIAFLNISFYKTTVEDVVRSLIMEDGKEMNVV